MRDARQYVTLPEPLPMRMGHPLPGVVMAYETWGTLDPDRGNIVLIVTGLSPSAHARSSDQNGEPGWWEAMIGPARAIDTDRFFVICVNSLGSCYGSTGPASDDPRTGRPYRLTFPVITVWDMAAAAHAAIMALGYPRIRAIVGPSLGGMVALAYAMLFADDVSALAVISGAPHALPLSVALRSLQREIVRSDPAWRAGEYAIDAPPVTGLTLARKLGLITYRSLTEWNARFGRRKLEEPPADQFGPRLEIEAYLGAGAHRFVQTFDANCYLYLSRAMDLFDVADEGGSVAAGLALIKTNDVLVVGVESDFLFPPEQQSELAQLLARPGRRLDFSLLPATHGHDSFLLDSELFAPVVGSFLRSL
jgi:homoserine O-acetyltransferase